MRLVQILLVPAALILFVIVSMFSQSIAFTEGEKAVLFGSGMLLIAAFIMVAFK